MLTAVPLILTVTLLPEAVQYGDRNLIFSAEAGALLIVNVTESDRGILACCVNERPFSLL